MILKTTLLNRIKLKHLGSEIEALDFNTGTVIVRTPGGELRTSHFDTTTLGLKS